jgi:hypothetical protein
MKGSLREVRIILEDLMSLNTLDKNTQGSRKPPIKGDSRSLRTDDIEGAKPRSGLRRQPDQGVYSGLNLPSYAPSNNPRQPLRAQNLSSDISKNAENFYGISPPPSPKEPKNQHPVETEFFSRNQEFQPENPQFNAKEVANFYGVTPPRSRAADPYGKREFFEGEGQFSQKDLANFYGVTPPMSRSNQNPQDFLGNYARPPKVDMKNYPEQGNSAMPVKVAAGFYGATPPASRAAGVSQKDMANFYGVTPPASGKVQSYEEPLNKPSYNPKYDMNYIQERREDLEAQGNLNYNPVPSKDMANFYGVTPPATGNKNVYSNGGPSGRDMANFYGVTPPATGSKNVYSNPGPSGKDMANFYGVTPPATGSKNVYSNPGPSGRDMANFYGVTPPPSGKPSLNVYNASENPYQNLVPNGSQGNYPDYYGNPGLYNRNEPLDPEFQYAADLALKANPVKAPEVSGSRGHNQVSTASRIFN